MNLAPPPVLVIGGGPAGAAAAIRLAARGRAVTLLERSTGPHDKICGEFLSTGAQGDLARLGLDVACLGAVPIDRLRLVHQGRGADHPLPFRGASLSRRVLDEALLTRAAACGVQVRRGVAVPGLQSGAGRAWPRDDPASGEGTIVLSTGKHTLRGAPRPAAASDTVGFKMYFRLPAARLHARQVAIHLFDGGYGGVEPVEGGRVNVCLLVNRSRLARAGGSWAGLRDWLAGEDAELGSLLAGATALLERPLTIAGVPYGFMYRPVADDPANLYRVGDQMAVIPSFCGDGMSMALRGGIAAADAILAGRSPHSHHRTLRRMFAPQMRAASVIAGVGQLAIGRSALVALAAAAPMLTGIALRLTRLPRTADAAADAVG